MSKKPNNCFDNQKLSEYSETSQFGIHVEKKIFSANDEYLKS